MIPKTAMKRVRRAQKAYSGSHTYENAVKLQVAERDHEFAKREHIVLLKEGYRD